MRTSNFFFFSVKYPHYETVDDYPSVIKRKLRDQVLFKKRGEDRQTRTSKHFTAKFIKEISNLPNSLSVDHNNKIRFVHISDTHMMHR